MATFGLPMRPTPSPAPILPDNPVSGLRITGTDDALSLKLVLSAQPVQFIVVLGARPQSPGVSYVDHYKILGLLPEPEGGLSDITALYLAVFKLLPPRQARLYPDRAANQRLAGPAQNPLRPDPRPVGRAPRQPGTSPLVSSPSPRFACHALAISRSKPPLYPLYSPFTPILLE